MNVWGSLLSLSTWTGLLQLTGGKSQNLGLISTSNTIALSGADNLSSHVQQLFRREGRDLRLKS
jgi:hypothetical protein